MTTRHPHVVELQGCADEPDTLSVMDDTPCADEPDAWLMIDGHVAEYTTGFVGVMTGTDNAVTRHPDGSATLRDQTGDFADVVFRIHWCDDPACITDDDDPGFEVPNIDVPGFGRMVM